MNWIEALILGLIQGLTEFLPVSSSGHLELGKAILKINAEKSLMFTVVVHGATVLSTIIVFWKDIFKLLKGLFAFKWNEETRYVMKLLFSMVPVVIIGLLFQEEIEHLFTANLILVGSMLLVTSGLLAFAHFYKPDQRNIGFWDALLMGVAQAMAVIPGISRSGATISTGLIIGNKKDQIAKFSFLMVLIPIIAANGKDLLDASETGQWDVDTNALIIGFIAAFISGLIACKWMIALVKRGKLIFFAAYCFVVGLIALMFGLFG